MENTICQLLILLEKKLTDSNIDNKQLNVCLDIIKEIRLIARETKKEIQDLKEIIDIKNNYISSSESQFIRMAFSTQGLYTLDDIAFELGMSVSHLANILNGHRPFNQDFINALEKRFIKLK